ncbi:MAG TPA: glycosyltransferase family 9 protein [Acidobacteriaceae bacterium]|nr:glycosyltransferase family 9 protein [Acidobacteriaceae bacterium]
MQQQAQFRLLVVRLGAMGDILHALPAVTALRKAHPAWRIDWAIEPHWMPLLTADSPDNEPDNEPDSEPDQESADEPSSDSSIEQAPEPRLTRPLVDRIYPVPAKKWSRTWFRRETLDEIRALRAELKAAQYDAVLDLQGSVRSALVAWLTGCQRIIGEADPREAPAKWFFSEQVATEGAHIIEQDLEVASAVAGDLLEHVPPALPFDATAEDWCDQHPELQEAHWRGRPLVLVHPGGGWGAKRWPADRYGAVAEELTMRGGTVLINAGPGEEELAAQVVIAANGHASAICCSLSQLIALTRRVSLVVGGDTGPLHLACALGKPVVGVYGPTDPKRNGPYGDHFRVLRNPESRQDHSRRAEPEAGLLTILPREVMAAAAEVILEEREGKQRRALEKSDGQVWEARR